MFWGLGVLYHENFDLQSLLYWLRSLLGRVNTASRGGLHVRNERFPKQGSLSPNITTLINDHGFLV